MKRIMVVGCGNVGSSFVFAAINKGLADEYLLNDINETLSEGQKLDLEDAIKFSPKPNAKIFVSSLKDAKNVDLIYITSGVPQKPGETRLDLVKTNSNIIKQIGKSIKESGFNGITLIASNPCDPLAYYYYKETGFPKNKVISTGTNLDSARFMIELEQLSNYKSEYNTSNFAGYIVGEHGDSSAHYVKNSSELSEEIIKKSHRKSIDKAYEIIKRKGSTYYGIAASVSMIADIILNNKNKVAIVGSYNEEHEIFVGQPTILGNNGVIDIVKMKLSDEQNKTFLKSCEIIKKFIK